MDALVHQLAKRGVDFPLPFNPVQAGECVTFDQKGEMALPARIVTSMADMLVALVFQMEESW